MGYELDYDFVANRSRKQRTKLDEREEQTKRKADLIGYADLDGVQEPACDNKVAHDLGIAFHEVGMEEYEEWHKKGFRVKPGEFDNIPREEYDKLVKVMEGSAFRKGSKRRCFYCPSPRSCRCLATANVCHLNSSFTTKFYPSVADQGMLSSTSESTAHTALCHKPLMFSDIHD